MATITATNQQYYASYPATAQSMMAANPAAASAAYQQQQQTVAAYAGHRQPVHYQHQQPHQPHHHHHLQHHLAGQTQYSGLTQLDAGDGSVANLDGGGGSAASTTPTALSQAANNSSSAIYTMEATTKSTRGASKLRRDLINTEIARLRELLPLPASTRQRLSQLQLMALVLVYVRKSNYFCNAFRNYAIGCEPSLAISTSGFSKALNGFLMMLTQKGKLLYISDNAAEYLGHSMEDLLSHGDEVYDIIEEQDKKTIRTELLSNDEDSQNNSPSSKSSVSSLSHQHQQQGQLVSGETKIALCRMNVSRNARRQMRFGDQKVVLIEGHYFGYLPLSSRDEPVFLATCTPIAMPETRESVVQGSTNVFTSIHSMDMKFLWIDSIGEHYLGCKAEQIHGTSWYDFIHNDYLLEAQLKHKRITANDQERSTIALLRFMGRDQVSSIWIHSVMQVREAADSSSQSGIVCINQVLSEREAQVMKSNSWLYQFYSLHSKMHCSYSENSPAANLADSHQQTATTPNSVCSDSVDDRLSDLKRSASEAFDAQATDLHESGTISTPPAPLLTTANDLSSNKSPPAQPQRDPPPGPLLVEASPPIRSSAGAEAFGSGSGAYATANGYHHQPVAINSSSAKKARLAAPLTHSPSSSSSSSSSSFSTIPSSPLSSSAYLQQQSSSNPRYHQLGSGILPANSIDQQTFASNQQYHNLGGSGGGGSLASSSASSTSSSSSSAQSSELLAAATPSVAAAGSSSSVAAVAAAAAGLYGVGLDSVAAAAAAIDPLQHVPHSHHSAAIYSATNQHAVAAAASHQHAAAAVNYANQVMAAQRVAAHQQSQQHHHHNHHHGHLHHSAHSHPHHHHHNPYHSYGHQQQQHHHHQSAAVAMHHHHHSNQQHHHQQASLAAPHHHHHHHSHHTSPAMYASPHHVAAAASATTAALSGAFGHHNHTAAAYHSVAAAAAASAGHHHQAHHHHSQAAASSLQSPYHSASAAAAAAAAVHQGVPFHYNKIAAAVNASA